MTTGAVGILVVRLLDDPNIGVNAPITSISEIPEILTASPTGRRAVNLGFKRPVGRTVVPSGRTVMSDDMSVL